MGYTLIDREEFDNVSTSEVDFTLNSDYDEILFVLSGFRPDHIDRELGFQFITSGESGYDRPIQTAVSGHWLYAYDYSHGAMRYEHAVDSDVSHAASASTQFARFAISAHPDYKAHGNASGVMTIYKPHDTSFYKYFLAESSGYQAHLSDWHQYLHPMNIAGYVKETAALTGIRFVTCTSGGDQEGNIQYLALSMYGLA